MPQYCKAGQKARVFFKINGQIVDNIVVRNSPVSVETVNNPAKAGQCCDKSYRISYSHSWKKPWGAIVGPYDKIADLTMGKVIFFKVNDSGMGVHSQVQRCNGVTFTQTHFNDSSDKVENLVIKSIIPIDKSLDNCGVADCTFLVKDSKGVVIWNKKYPQCPEVEVVCDRDCPEGQINCGGKCVPCEDLSGQFRSLSQQIRRI